MAKLSKRTKSLRKQTDDLEPQEVPAAVTTLKSLEQGLPEGVEPCKFDQTVEVAIRLGVDPKHADQMVRGSIVFPHGIGKEQRILVFTQGPNVAKAEEAGADFVGGKDLADKVKDGFTDFDVAIATPDMMGVVGPLGRVLGPRGLMPSPRAGTVTTDVAGAVKEYKAGKVEFKTQKDVGVVHCVIGKLSFSAEQLTENLEAFMSLIRQLKPVASKGTYIRSVTLSATQLPGVPIVAA